MPKKYNKKTKEPEDPISSIGQVFNYLHDNISVINNSKIFAGLMIIILNISSKFVTIKLSKTMESYLKHTFSKQILVFAIAWMGTRDIYIAFLITIFFIIFFDFLFNEDSPYCCLPKKFMDYHLSLIEDDEEEEENSGSGSSYASGSRGSTIGSFSKLGSGSGMHKKITTQDIKNAYEILEIAKKQKEQQMQPSYYGNFH